MDAEEQATVHKWLTAPEPDHPAKPRWPWQLSARSWRYVARRSWAEFWFDNVLDHAGNLTYMAMQALFPALLAILAALSVVGQGQAAVDWMVSFLRRAAPAAIADLVSEPLLQLASVAGAGWVLGLALVAALWAASGYVAAFGRTVNRIYGVVEGRPLWQIIPYNLMVTVLLLLFGVFVVLSVLLSASIWETVASYIDLPETELQGLRQLRWVILGIAAFVTIAALFRATPNVRQPRLRWTLVGAALAMALSFLAVAGFSAWVGAFGTFNAAYGVIGSFVILLLGMWLMNVALLLGVELNAEVERARLLQAGFPAEEELLVQPRNTRMIRARAQQETRLRRDAIDLKGRRPPPPAPPDRAERGQPGKRSPS